jgi:hypothetical protein
MLQLTLCEAEFYSTAWFGGELKVCAGVTFCVRTVLWVCGGMEGDSLFDFCSFQ